VSGIDRYLVRPHTVLLFSQTTACDLSTHLLRSTAQLPSYPYRPDWLSNHVGLPSLTSRHSPA